MRLLKTAPSLEGRLETADFPSPYPPPYAILSHTWSDDEVAFADLKHPAIVVERCGYGKIRMTLQQARGSGLEWAWIDTCCINKDSSAELSEAINAMYTWYAKADICYAYLADVDREDQEWQESFKKSRWFSRGWTLQELLAPNKVRFYDRHWTEMGDKSTLLETLHTASQIDHDFLLGHPLSSASIAKRMSWAARRDTTREEDLAYCLLGIFDVNMPMLYGEGSKAFIRLQEEIMKSSDDHTLFAWEDLSLLRRDTNHCGLLALSPIAFAYTGNMVPYAKPTAITGSSGRPQRQAFSASQRPVTHTVTNRGIYVELSAGREFAELQPEGFLPARPGEILAMLDCTSEGGNSYVAVALVPTGESEDHFARSRIDTLFRLQRSPTFRRPLYIRQRDTGLMRAPPPFHYIRFGGWRLETGSHTYDELTAVRSLDENKRQVTCAVFVDNLGDQGLWMQRSGQAAKAIAIQKGSLMLSACMVIGTGSVFTTRRDFILAIGSDRSWDLAFDIWTDDASPKMGAWTYNVWGTIRRLDKELEAQNAMPPPLQRKFRPKPPGEPMEIGDLVATVEVDVEAQDEDLSAEHVVIRDRIRNFRLVLRRKGKSDGSMIKHRLNGLTKFGRPNEQ